MDLSPNMVSSLTMILITTATSTITSAIATTAPIAAQYHYYTHKCYNYGYPNLFHYCHYNRF